MGIDDVVQRTKARNAAIAIGIGAAVGSVIVVLLPLLAIVSIGGDGSTLPPIKIFFSIVDRVQTSLNVSSGTAVLLCGVVAAAASGGSLYVALQWISRPTNYDAYREAAKTLRSPMSIENFCAKYGLSQAVVEGYIEQGQVRAYQAPGVLLIEDAAPLRLRRPGKDAAQHLERPVHVARYCANYDVTEAQVNGWIGQGKIQAYEDGNGLFVSDKPPPAG